MSAGFTPGEVAHCSFCGRDGGQSHTENCPAREEEGEYVEEVPSLFDAAAQAIRDELDRRDATITALCDALEGMLGLLTLIGSRNDIPVELKDALLENHRVTTAHEAISQARGEQ